MKNSRYYRGRDDKPAWVVAHFNKQFAVGSVADIGCDKKQLKQYLSPQMKYVGIDISPQADIHFDLDSRASLPVRDREFELVVALDVLEHLEQIHQVFDESCRISSQYVLISLPNNLQASMNGYMFGKHDKDPERRLQYGKHLKFYGLPFERPADRHRWFFNSEDAEDFVRYRAHKNGFELTDVQYEFDYIPPLKRIMKFILAGCSRRRALNFFSGTIFFILERK